MLKKNYFPNLNGLRFIAAIMVFIHHMELLKSSFNLSNFWENKSIFILGKLGVVLFFVLSGFLITYLLLEEEQQTKKINIKNFFKRRILRIWPLYYLILILSFFILPNFQFFEFPGKPFSFSDFPLKALLLYLFMLPNMAAANLASIPFASQSWSIGTEEQFYIIWPFIFILFKKYRMQAIFLVLAAYLIIKYILSVHDLVIGNLSLKN